MQRSTLSVPGLPGTLCGWNQNGLVAWVGRSIRSSDGNAHTRSPASIAVDYAIRTTGSMVDATDLLRQMCPLDAPVFLLCMSEQKICGR